MHFGDAYRYAIMESTAYVCYPQNLELSEYVNAFSIVRKCIEGFVGNSFYNQNECKFDKHICFRQYTSFKFITILQFLKKLFAKFLE